MTTRSFASKLFRRKHGSAYDVVVELSHSSSSSSTHSLFDLLCIGVGATAGSGVFVVTGLVAHSLAGPAVVLSWVIAGVACLLSALSFAELSAAIPSSGSAYAYVYCTLGELPAVLAAWCLTLECGVSGAAVARNWGAKLSTLLGEDLQGMDTGLSPYGTALMTLAVLLLYLGTETTSKAVVNAFTVLKVLLMLFLIVCGFCFFHPANLAPAALLPFGWNGVFRGSTACFFGFVGFDEVCCLAAETENPQRVMPLAVVGTVLCVSALYVLSSVALCGMQRYSEIDSQSGFAMALYAQRRREGVLLGDIAAVGELVSLPLVTLVSLLPQPRILLALARDGLLSQRFLSQRFNILVSGAVCVLITLCVPFAALDELISAGALLAFVLTNTSLVLLRLDDDTTHWRSAHHAHTHTHSLRDTAPQRGLSLSRCKRWLLLFHASCVAVVLLVQHTHALSATLSAVLAATGGLWLVFVAVALHRDCPDNVLADDDTESPTSSSNNENARTEKERERDRASDEDIVLVVVDDDEEEVEVSLHGDVVSVCPLHAANAAANAAAAAAYEQKSSFADARQREKMTFDMRRKGLFRVPGVPFTPLLGIFVNYFLICQISAHGFLLLLAVLSVATLLYLLQRQPWKEDESTHSRYAPLSCPERLESDGGRAENASDAYSYGALSPIAEDSQHNFEMRHL